MDYIERPFIDIMTGAIGILALLIMVLAMYTITNAKIELEVDAPIKNDLYPMFAVCEDEKVVLVCRNSYLGPQDMKNSLMDTCVSLRDAGIASADQEQQWDIMSNFFSSNWFDREHFYVFALIRPRGVASFNKLRIMLEQNSIHSGYIPIPENWDIREGFKL